MKERIVALRTELGLNQAEFSKKIGLSRSGLASIEVGQNPLRDRHIKLIKAAFPQVSEAWLKDGVGEMFVTDKVTDLLYEWKLEDFCRELLEEVEEFDLEQQQYILRFLQGVVARLSGRPAETEQELTAEQMEMIERKTQEYQQALIEQEKVASRPSSLPGLSEMQA